MSIYEVCAELVATINHGRMPVLLTGEEQFETWLQGSPRDAFALARRYPAEAMRIVQAGLEKGGSRQRRRYGQHTLEPTGALLAVMAKLDPEAEFLFVPEDKVLEAAQREAAIPFDVKGVENCVYSRLPSGPSPGVLAVMTFHRG